MDSKILSPVDSTIINIEKFNTKKT